MAELLLVAGVDNTTPDPNQRRIGYYFPDIMTRETVSRANTITDEPIESGEYIQDHVFRLPLTLEIQGLHGDGSTKINPDTGEAIPEVGRTQLAFDVLQELAETKTPFEVVIGYGVFSNMLIEQLDLSQSSDVGDALQYDVRLKQITTVSSRVAEGRIRTRTQASAGGSGTVAGSDPTVGGVVNPAGASAGVTNKVPTPTTVGNKPVKTVQLDQARLQRVKDKLKQAAGG